MVDVSVRSAPPRPRRSRGFVLEQNPQSSRPNNRPCLQTERLISEPWKQIFPPQICQVLLLVVLLLAGFAPAHAQAPIWVLDARGGPGTRGALFSVDPSSGFRILISDFGASTQGPRGISPVGVAAAP